ncbi:GFA family protein [Cupriavidus pinatubonensis]|uniref:CENP-V/GFA domain-containing protein n=1 Tax=Cupriavidus pinatubonensis TaxID=248026 RepID=A0ABM8XX96_9BURK|nr:hypothetical protein LMG23994_05569 [Cupriavidus pinatubonensis]
MQTYTASCHCGLVRYQFTTSLNEVVECNCSYCRRKAALHHRVMEAEFTLLEGETALSAYKFGTMTATHYFCSQCGSHTHCRPRSNPLQVNVNVRMMDNFDEVKDALQIRQYNGKSWDL